MAAYNLTINAGAAEEKGLDFVLARVNAPRLAAVPPLPAMTKQQYLQGLVDGLVTDYKKQQKQDFRERVGTALDAATGAKVTQVAVALGVSE